MWKIDCSCKNAGPRTILFKFDVRTPGKVDQLHVSWNTRVIEGILFE